MSMALLFWILMLLWLVFGLWWHWPNYPTVGFNLMLFLLIGILGWHAFGAPVHG